MGDVTQFPVMMDYIGLRTALTDESDLCRNDGADDIADLLSEGVRAIETLTAENETLRAENARLREELRQIYVDTIEQFGDWRNLPPANDEASNFVFDIARHARRALKGGEND